MRQCVSRVTQRVCIAPQTTTDREKAGAAITRPRPNTVERKKKEIFSYPSSRIP